MLVAEIRKDTWVWTIGSDRIVGYMTIVVFTSTWYAEEAFVLAV